jgi:hypothetical protein
MAAQRFCFHDPCKRGGLPGQPMTYWFAIVEKHKQKKHMEIVGVLKSEHAMGHGHANAVVAFYLANNSK